MEALSLILPPPEEADEEGGGQEKHSFSFSLLQEEKLFLLNQRKPKVK
jgi:hypothetical protein